MPAIAASVFTVIASLVVMYVTYPGQFSSLTKLHNHCFIVVLAGAAISLLGWFAVKPGYEAAWYISGSLLSALVTLAWVIRQKRRLT